MMQEMNGSSVGLVELVSYRATDGAIRKERRVVANQVAFPTKLLSFRYIGFVL
jgi:hypothetical protein